MKKLLIISLWATIGCLMSQTATAQEAEAATPKTTIIVEGVLLDSLTHEGEPYATLRILRKSSSGTPAAMGVTDMEGHFNLPLHSHGTFVLSVTSVGRKPFTKEFRIEPEETKADLGLLYLSEASEMLQGVEVVAQKPLVKMDVDQISYSMKDDPDAKTNTLLEMLRKVPMVTVDGEDNIKVNGSSSFQVFVNGKPNAMMSANPSQTLKAMPATGIKSVEVLTNPGAKYDAEGVGGILNINTEGGSNMEGYSLSLNAQAGSMVQGGGAYALMQAGKLTLSANLNASHVSIPEVGILNIRQDENSRMDYRGSTHGHTQLLFGNFDASYEIDSLNSLSASIGLFNTPQQMYGDATTDILRNDIPTFSYSTRTENHTRNFSLNGSIDYRHIFANNPQHTLTLAYRLGMQPKKTDATTLFSIDGHSDDALASGLTDRRNTDRNNMQEHTFQADYTLPLAQGHEIETGAKYILRRNSSESRELDYRHNSNISALYAAYNLHTGAFGMKTGVRYEHTAQRVKFLSGNGTDFDLKYDNLVPSLSLSYNLAERQQLGLGYNLRISRPGIGFLNPYVNDQEPTHITYGNPALKPEKAHSLSLTYNLFSGRFMLNANLRHTFLNNGLEEYTRAEEDVLYTTYDNIGRRRTTEFSLFLNWNMLPLTRLTLNATTAYMDLRSPSLGYRNHGWQQSVMVGMQHTLPWKLRASANFFGNTRGIALQGHSAGFSIHTLSLSRTFLKDDRLSLSVTAINPFLKSIKMDSDLSSTDFTQTTRCRMPLRSVMMGVSLRIGNLKPKQKTITAIESDVRDKQDENSQLNSIIIPR